jgi:MoaA/NifB/PqqE/SkfB family radical SAM enzyme
MQSNWEVLSSEGFTDEMIGRGCTLGFHTEYVPVGRDTDMSLMLDDRARAEFRNRILRLRETKPLLLIHLPDDEYGDTGECQGVTGGTVHINSQGYAEPCPFCHYASDNVSDKSLEEVINSPFLARLRSSDAVYRRTSIGCALVENCESVRKIAAETGAKPTEKCS